MALQFCHSGLDPESSLFNLDFRWSLSRWNSGREWQLSGYCKEVLETLHDSVVPKTCLPLILYYSLLSFDFSIFLKSLVWPKADFFIAFLRDWFRMKLVCSRGRNCQVSGTGKYLAGHSLIARNMFIPVVQRISIQKAPVGRVPIPKMRSCLASKGIAEVARFLSFIPLLKLILIPKIPQRKTLHRKSLSVLNFNTFDNYLAA